MTHRKDLCSPWQVLKCQAVQAAAWEPLLADMLHHVIAQSETPGAALAHLLAGRLASGRIDKSALRDGLAVVFDSAPRIAAATEADLRAAVDSDPARPSFLNVFLFYKGFLALQAYRAAHALWQQERRTLALFLQNRMSEVFGVDIHPAARIGTGIVLDHATGLVIGETAAVGDRVALFHDVTLGGTGKETGERHPKVGDDVLIGAGARVLGNVQIGRGARIGAASVVLTTIPAFATAVGVPARVVAIHGKATGPSPHLGNGLAGSVGVLEPGPKPVTAPWPLHA